MAVTDGAEGETGLDALGPGETGLEALGPGEVVAGHDGVRPARWAAMASSPTRKVRHSGRLETSWPPTRLV